MSYLMALFVGDINTIGVDFREKQRDTNYYLASIANKFIFFVSFTLSIDSLREKNNNYARKCRFGLSSSIGALRHIYKV